MLKKILIPVDSSAFSEVALPTALKLSRRADAEIRLAMVSEPDGATGTWREAFRSAHVTYLKSLESKVAKGVVGPASTALLDGDVADALCQEATRWGADLIVMSTHGRGGLSRWWLGSVSDAIVRQSSTPVLLVRPPEGDEPSDQVDEPTIRRIVIPLDGSTLAEAAIEPALELGSLLGASFTLLRVIAYPIVVSSHFPQAVQTDPLFLQEVEGAARAYLERVRMSLADGSRQIDIEVVVNQQPALGILDYVAENGADLVSIATHGRSPRARVLLGSTADKVIRGAHTPVLIVRPVDEEAGTQTEAVA